MLGLDENVWVVRVTVGGTGGGQLGFNDVGFQASECCDRCGVDDAEAVEA